MLKLMDKTNTKERKKLFVVLGMHRSGTSAITRGLQVMNVVLGDRLMKIDEGNNDKGFWEDVDINGLNVEMLNALNNDWHQLSLIKKDDWKLLKSKGYFARASEMLRQKTLHTDYFGFKDPRMSKLLPFWKEVFNHGNFDVNYILAVRHPLSVALSLAKRNGIDIEKSHFLWLIHTIYSLSEIEDNSYVVVDYDNLMQDAGHELQRMAEKFHLTIDHSEFNKYKSEFLDEGLRHTRFTYENLMTHERSFDLLRDVYAMVKELATENTINEDMLRRITGEWEEELEKLSFSFKMADGAFYQLNLVYLQTLEKDEQIAKEKEAKELETQKLNESMEKSHRQEEHIEQLNQQLSEKANIIAEKENIIADKEIIITQKNESISNKLDIIADQEEIITKKEQIISEKERIILQERNEKNQLLASRSWRYTKPLRNLAKLFRKK
jgi:O-antigen biosynthesis protein